MKFVPKFQANKKKLVIKNLFHYSLLWYKVSSIFLMEIARFYCNLMRLLFRMHSSNIEIHGTFTLKLLLNSIHRPADYKCDGL